MMAHVRKAKGNRQVASSPGPKALTQSPVIANIIPTLRVASASVAITPFIALPGTSPLRKGHQLAHIDPEQLMNGGSKISTMASLIYCDEIMQLIG